MPETIVSLRSSQKLYDWGVALIRRFSRSIDSRLLRAFDFTLGAATPSFFQTRSPMHCKRLLLANFFLQKEMERKLSRQESRPVCVQVFLEASQLCIAIAYSRQEGVISEDAILEIASQRISSLKKVERSGYHWICPDLPYAICYVELEKVRGAIPLRKEGKWVKEELYYQLPRRLSGVSIFWPYNHEEAFKQLLILEKEITSTEDDPQVTVRFQKQTFESLEFLVYLVRPKHLVSQSVLITAERFPPSIQLIHHVKRELGCEIPCLAEAFSLVFPLKNFRSGNTVNLLYAREFVAKLLLDVIGTFRDYNGGLFETQKSRFKQLSDEFSAAIPHFSLFGKDVFYALEPIEAQVGLELELFKELFLGVAKSLAKKAPCVYRVSPRIAILLFEKSSKVHAYLEWAGKLQEEGKITAYAGLHILSKGYFCLIDKTGSHLKQLELSSSKVVAARKNCSLRLAFQAQTPSLSPYYLAKEIRGRILAKLLFEGLFRIDPHLQTRLADCERFTVSKNKQCYLFYVRSDSFWSNGEKVTAFHYEAAWKRNFLQRSHLDLFYILKNATAIKEGNLPITKLGVRALNEKCLEVRLEQEDPSFLEKLSHPLFFPSPGSASEPRVFNGPYLLAERNEERMLLEQNPYFWDRKTIFFDRMKISTYDAFYTLDCSSAKNEMDWIGTPCFFNMDFSTLQRREKIFFPFIVHFNTQHFSLSSPLIRSALSAVIERDFIANAIFSKGKPIYTLLGDEPPSDTLFKKANTLFAKGLEELNLTKKTFPPLKITSAGITTHLKMAKYLQERWKKTLGVDVNLEIQDCCNNFHQKIERGDFQVGCFFRDIFPADLFPFFEGFSEKETNYSRWSHPEYASLIEAARKAKTLKEKNERLIEVEKCLFHHAPISFIVTLTHHYNHHPKLKDYVINHDGSIDFRFASLALPSPSST